MGAGVVCGSDPGSRGQSRLAAGGQERDSKTDTQTQTPTCLPLSFFSGSSSSCSGSFFSRSSTVYESFTLEAISLRNCSSCFWPTTRVLPNQRRSGWMRVLGSSLDCSSCVIVRV